MVQATSIFQFCTKFDWLWTMCRPSLDMIFLSEVIKIVDDNHVILIVTSHIVIP